MDKSTFSLDVRLRIWASDYGRLSEWLMERRGHPIAMLSDPQRKEGPWTSYRFTPVTQDTALLAEMKTEKFWKELNGITWRSRDFNTVVAEVAAADSTHLDISRVTLRGMSIPIAPPNILQQQMVKARKKGGK
jgi:hypothetical protein